MHTHIPIRYTAFYDVPRTFFAEVSNRRVLFDSRFDEALDEYDPSFNVYLMPTGYELPPTWEGIESQAERLLGRVPVTEVHFHPTEGWALDKRILHWLEKHGIS